MNKACSALVLALCLGFALPAFAEEPASPPVKEESVKTAPAPKKRRSFDDCDTNKDGALSLEEFGLCYPKKKASFQAVDADGDGKVTKAELKAHRSAGKAPGAGTGKKRASFDDADKDKDGALTLEEFLVLSPKGKDKFSKIDADGDGKVTKAELKAYRAANRKPKASK